MCECLKTLYGHDLPSSFQVYKLRCSRSDRTGYYLIADQLLDLKNVLTFRNSKYICHFVGLHAKQLKESKRHSDKGTYRRNDLLVLINDVFLSILTNNNMVMSNSIVDH